MPTWKIAAVQMDCKLADPTHNLAVMRTRLREAARQGARLVIFPECALTGYCFESRDEAFPLSEPLPGPMTDALAADCRELNVFAVAGLLERDGDKFYNAAALVGPRGFVAGYRKAHLPCLGVDHFSTPGDRPFAVHDIDGLRVGMNICYDGSFPEASRCLMLLGADLIVLPTNWPPGAVSTIKYLVQCRALENNVYYAAVNRVGEERGFRFVGQSRIVACSGELLAAAGEAEETILYAEIDPSVARNKHIVRILGKHEVHRAKDRRPDLYGPLVSPNPPAGL
jgi:predicted amidohydrolase